MGNRDGSESCWQAKGVGTVQGRRSPNVAWLFGPSRHTDSSSTHQMVVTSMHIHKVVTTLVLTSIHGCDLHDPSTHGTSLVLDFLPPSFFLQVL
jgi:hypothetical protein